MNKGQRKRLTIVLVPLIILGILILYVNIFNSIKNNSYECWTNNGQIKCSGRYKMVSTCDHPEYCPCYYQSRYLRDFFGKYTIQVSYWQMSKFLGLGKEKLGYGDFCFGSYIGGIRDTDSTTSLGTNRFEIKSIKHIEVMEKIKSLVDEHEYDTYKEAGLLTIKYSSIPIIFLFTIWIISKTIKWIIGSDE